MKDAPARRLVAPRLALALLALLAALCAAELVARARYVAPWHQRLVAAQRAAQELPYERNTYNLRGPDYLGPKPAGARRILMIGDSFTFGMGVARDEDTFARRVERALRERLAPEGVAGVEILNASIIGSLTGHWLELWEALAPRFRPDLVVFVFFLRDGTLAGSVPEFFDVVRDELAARSAASPLYRRSYLYRTLRDARDREQIRSHYTRAFRSAYFGSEEERSEWRNAQANLRRMAREARERGIQPAFVLFPILAGLDEQPYPFQDVCDLLLDFARSEGLPTLDLLPAFRGREASELWVSPFDQHPNERAHAIAAEALTPFLAQLLGSGVHSSGPR